MTVRRNGGDCIVVNPMVESGLVNFRVPSDVRSLLFGTKIATQYVQPHIGGDLAMLYGIAKRIEERDAVDHAFIAEHCTGWPELQARLRELAWEEIEAKSGVSREEIDAMAQRYARSKNTVFMWTMGITHHIHGVANVQAIANLALLRGMIGRRHAGVLPIRGHSNVQGMGTVGVTPKLKDAVFQQLQNHFGVRLPTAPGYDTIAGMEAAGRGELKFAMCLGGNLFGSNPDASFARQALQQVDLVVYLNTTLNTGHAYGLGRETIILPVLARDEEPEPTTQESMFSYIRLSDGGPRRHEGPRSEIEVIADIAERVSPASGPIDWRSMRHARAIRETIAKIVPGLEQLSTIDETKKEFPIPGRAFHTPTFATPDGKAHLHVHDLPELAGTRNEERGTTDQATQPPISSPQPPQSSILDPQSSPPLRLMTIRSEGQFNTVVYEDYDLYRGVERRNVILMHPNDIAARGLSDGARVRVTSDTAAMSDVSVHAFPDIRAGNVAMYYPEANALVSRTVDPLSRTPAFKCVLVTVEAIPAPQQLPVTRRAPAASGTGHGDNEELVVQPAAGVKSSRDQMRSC
jgi:molybdopterin-dependent oxidoreductase alpha subunit